MKARKIRTPPGSGSRDAAVSTRSPPRRPAAGCEPPGCSGTKREPCAPSPVRGTARRSSSADNCLLRQPVPKDCHREEKRGSKPSDRKPRRTKRALESTLPGATPECRQHSERCSSRRCCQYRRARHHFHYQVPEGLRPRRSRPANSEVGRAALPAQTPAAACRSSTGRLPTRH